MESFYSGVRHASEEDLEMKNLDDYAAERLIKSTWEKKGGTKVTGVVVKKDIMNHELEEGKEGGLNIQWRNSKWGTAAGEGQWGWKKIQQMPFKKKVSLMRLEESREKSLLHRMR